MFELIYAKNVTKDIKQIPTKSLLHIKHLSNHPVAEYRLRIGKYRVLFDVDWNNHQILILKIGHRSHIYQ